MRLRFCATASALLVLALLAGCAPAATPAANLITASSPTPLPEPNAASSPLPPTEPPATASPLPPTAPSISAPATPSTGGQGNADVLHVRAVLAGNGTWTFHVTVQHPDTGWEDYADGWDVLTPDGQVLKPDPDSPFTRLLLHPHVGEQPFTRSQSGIAIPAGVSQVRVRAHDLVDGYGGREVLVDLTIPSGPDFEVEGAP